MLIYICMKNSVCIRSLILRRTPQIKVGNEIIKPSPVVRNLGAYFDSTMCMVPHVNNCIKNIYYHLRRISGIRRHLNNDTCAKSIHAFVTSCHDFNNALCCYSVSCVMTSRLMTSTATRTTKCGHREIIALNSPFQDHSHHIENNIETISFINSFPPSCKDEYSYIKRLNIIEYHN